MGLRSVARRLLRGLHMPSPKVVFVTRFELPTESAFCGRPEHEISNGPGRKQISEIELLRTRLHQRSPMQS
jgi:hypothetical protein